MTQDIGAGSRAAIGSPQFRAPASLGSSSNLMGAMRFGGSNVFHRSILSLVRFRERSGSLVAHD
jgi:hypothetical protein